MKTETKERYINSSEAEELELMKEPQNETDIMYEDTRKRAKNTKHFRLKNGNYRAVIYDHPVHKYDEESGRFVDIPTDYGETENDYEAEFDNYKVKFPKKDGKRRFITVNKGEKRFSWRYAFEKEGERNTRASAHLHSVNKNKWENERSHIKYEKIDGKSDLEYSVNDRGIKESIILSECPESSVFSFEIKMHGLVPRLSEDKKRVELVSDKAEFEAAEAEMVIPEPNMVDNRGAYSEELHYEIRKTEKGTFLDVVANNAWLADPDRVYPVTVDPVIEIIGGRVGFVKVVEVASGGTVNPENNVLRVGTLYNYAHRFFVGIKRCDMPELPEGTKVSKAEIVLTKWISTSQNSCENYGIYSFDSIEENNLTWATSNTFEQSSMFRNIHALTVNKGEKLHIDIKNKYDEWMLDRSSENYCGIMLKKYEEDININSHISFKSNYSSNSFEHPTIYIEYVPEDKYSDNQKFHTFEIGRAGIGKVNLYTGKLSFVHSDVSLNNSPLPINVSHIYRPMFEEGKYGLGWKVSAEQNLNLILQNDVYATYVDAQGRLIYFDHDHDGNISDTMGLGLKLTCETDPSTSESNYKISDTKDTVLKFNSNGKLIEIKNVNNKGQLMIYEGGNLSEITEMLDVDESCKKTVKFTYDSTGKLEKMIDVDDDELTYQYDNGKLVSITYPYSDGSSEKTTFEYNISGLLSKIIDRTGIAYEVLYDEFNRVYAITRTGNCEISNGNIDETSIEADDTIIFEYRTNSTVVKNLRTGVKEVNVFEENGRPIISYIDKTEVVDNSLKTATTMTELFEYMPRMRAGELASQGKYRSTSAVIGTDIKNQDEYLSNNMFTDIDLLSGTPKDWTIDTNNTSGEKVSQDIFPVTNNNTAYRAISRNSHDYTKISQTVTINEAEAVGNIFVASAWAKLSKSCGVGRLRLCLKIEHTEDCDDTTNYDFEDAEYYQNFDISRDDWQYVAVPFGLITKNVSFRATVKLEFMNMVSPTTDGVECEFTNVRLVSVDGTQTIHKYGLTYGSPNVFGTQQTIKRRIEKYTKRFYTKEEYNEADDLVISWVMDRINGGSFVTKNKYDYKHNLIKTEDYRGIVTDYTYNECGKVASENVTYNGDYTHRRHAWYSYDVNNALLVTCESDPRVLYDNQNLVKQYLYDDKGRGLVVQTTDFNGQIYTNTYDDKTDEQIRLKSVDDNNIILQNDFSYTRGYLTKLTHNNFDFDFSFDALGREKSVYIDNSNIFTNTYSKMPLSDSMKTVYASGEETILTSDLLGNPISRTYKGANDTGSHTLFTAKYDGVGNLTEYIDNETEICYNYLYDRRGNVSSVSEVKDGAFVATYYKHDAKNRLESTTYGATGHKYKPIYEKDNYGYDYLDDAVVGVELEGKYVCKTPHDNFGRTEKMLLEVSQDRDLELKQIYTYLSVPDAPYSNEYYETDFIASVQDIVNDLSQGVTSYTYDKSGNIETVSEDNVLVAKYYYDKWNRLVREDNHKLSKTYTWSYDIGGNILEKRIYGLCTGELDGYYEPKIYCYETTGNRDRMACYNGECCVYDSLGNPTMYRCHSLEWTRARKLARFDFNTFEYNAEGIRFKKNNTAYTLAGTKILKETTDSNTITYYYGTGVAPIGFNYNGTNYYFRKNIQGDVVAIYDKWGFAVAKYVYDAWGNHKIYDEYGAEVTSTNHIGYINPIRYRGYYFDVETNLYYLQTRYYDPETGRFLNSDAIEYLNPEQLGGLNLYSYCNNNPVISIDPTGSSWNSFWKGVGDWLDDNMDIVVGAVVTVAVATISIATAGVATVAIGMAVGAAVGAGFGALNAYTNGDSVLAGAITGAAVGLMGGIGSASLAGMAMSALGSATAAFTSSLCVDKINGREKDYQKAIISATTAGVLGGLGNGAGNYMGDPGAGKFVEVIGNAMGSFFFSTYTFVADAIINALRSDDI